MNNKCKICTGEVQLAFEATVLKKHAVNYFKCNECGFMQTEEPYWLDEAYSSAITFLDIGLVSRNVQLSTLLPYIIDISFNPNEKFIDYAGGYGMLVRLMRDKGYDFYRQDTYCDNLFAKTFDVTDIKIDSFELLTAFEIFEHLNDPLEEVKKMLNYSRSIFFSTELLPDNGVAQSTDWWYIVPETGQHIAFYTEKALHILAEKAGLKYFKLTNSLHFFSDKNIDIKKIIKITQNNKLKFLYRKLNLKKRKSLLPADYNNIIGRKVF